MPDRMVGFVAATTAPAFGHAPDTPTSRTRQAPTGEHPLRVADDRYSGIITDLSFPSRFLGRPHGLIEGFEVEYDENAYLAANADFDDDGETVWAALGPENADWTHPVLPNSRLKIGELWMPNVSPTCRMIIPVNGVPFNIWVDHSLAFAGVETVVAMEGGRRMLPRTAGTKVYLLGNSLLPDGSPDPDPTHQDVLAEGVTDRMGYAAIYPVQADRIRNYKLVTEDELDDDE